MTTHTREPSFAPVFSSTRSADASGKFADETLPSKFGDPFKIRVPTKFGYKNPKWVTTIFVANRQPGGFREDRGYNWFGGS